MFVYVNVCISSLWSFSPPIFYGPCLYYILCTCNITWMYAYLPMARSKTRALILYICMCMCISVYLWPHRIGRSSIGSAWDTHFMLCCIKPICMYRNITLQQLQSIQACWALRTHAFFCFKRQKNIFFF